MSASGLIYAAIAIMWAAVLIPMWLRNHESATENRSAERFGQAMRVLSRKESGADGDDHDDHETSHVRDDRPDVERTAPAARPRPSAPARPKVTVAQRVAQRVTQRVTQRGASRPAPRRPATSATPRTAPLTLAQRRARTLGVLAGLTLVMIMLSVLTPVPWWAAAPFLLLMAAFVVHLRVQARQKLARRRPSRTTKAPKVDARRPDAAPQQRRRADAAPQTADGAEAPSSSEESGVVQGPSRAVVVERKGEASASDGDDEGTEAWRPNPLPLPTYVTAPKAVRPIKVIDLTTPGAWSSGRLLEDDVADEDLLAAQVAEEELDALIGNEVAAAVDPPGDDGRRAVGD